MQGKELTMTSIQSGLRAPAFQAYREKMFDLLAGRDPIEVLGQTASALAKIVAAHPAEVLRERGDRPIRESPAGCGDALRRVTVRTKQFLYWRIKSEHDSV